MYKITYQITDAKDVKYEGTFVTYINTPRRITAKIHNKHPEICVPFKHHNVEVKKV